jgi:signal peptidase I
VNHPVADPSVSPVPLPSTSEAVSFPPSTPIPTQVNRHVTHHAPTGLLPALQSLFSIIIIAIFIITFCVQPFRIPSESMESTLLVGDFLLVNKQTAGPGGAGSLLPPATIKRGDIIVFHDPVDASLHLVKRVIGLPGDRIRLHDRHVYINGNALTEPYAIYRPGPPDNFRDNFPRLQSADPDINSLWWIRMRKLIDNDELIIPVGNYFVLGDNRNDSEDSRYWGFVPRDAIVGKPLLIYFSLQQHSNDDPDDTDTGLLTQPSAARNRAHHPASRIDAVVDFARWGRTLQIVK